MSYIAVLRRHGKLYGADSHWTEDGARAWAEKLCVRDLIDPAGIQIIDSITGFGRYPPNEEKAWKSELHYWNEAAEDLGLITLHDMLKADRDQFIAWLAKGDEQLGAVPSGWWEGWIPIVERLAREKGWRDWKRLSTFRVLRHVAVHYVASRALAP